MLLVRFWRPAHELHEAGRAAKRIVVAVDDR
jgi:hypothetical protein